MHLFEQSQDRTVCGDGAMGRPALVEKVLGQLT